MKYIVFILLVLAGAGSKAQKATHVTQIELSKESRGAGEHIRITKDSVFVSTEDRKNNTPGLSYSRAITEEQWTNLVATVRSIKLTDIPKLPAPTMNRASDAAMHATLIIYTKDGKSYAHGYDDENPNALLQPLRTAIREIAKQREE